MDNEHSDKCEKMRLTSEHYTGCEVRTLELPAGIDEDTFFAFWTNELAGMGPGDLVVVYYHGYAYDRGQDYKWVISREPLFQINASHLMDQIHATGVDCVFLLDAYIATRFQKKYQHDDANVEIISRGELVRDVNGVTVRGPGDFTDALLANMQKFLLTINNTRVRAPRSFNKIVAKDKKLFADPPRVWTKVPKKGSQTVVRRIMAYPPEMRATGLTDFVAMQIQPLPEVNGGAAGAQEVVVDEEDEDEEEDEGFEEGNGGDNLPLFVDW